MIAEAKQAFFEQMEIQGLALTYDDVRMRTGSGRREMLPDVIDITSRFSEKVELKIPFVSAAMDTVTTSEMAIAMAKLGGLGVIHGAMTIDQQYKEVRRVKKEVHGLIDEPVCISEDFTLQAVLNLQRDKRYNFNTFPVIDSSGKFVGILSGDDFKYPDSLDVTVREAMTPAKKVKSAHVDTSLESAYRRMQKNKINTLPLLEKDGSVGGMYIFSDVSRIYRDLDQYNVDSNKQLCVAAAVSTGKDTLERVEKLSKYVDVIVIDTADGDSYFAFHTLKEIKDTYGDDLQVVIGNISDGASARELAEAGANGIKVGQGPGSICSTRRETGIGMPQVTAVQECVKALGNDFANIPVCADGGIKEHGDIPIAFAARASSVMMGKMLAGTEQAPGEVIKRADGSKYKLYAGMGSKSRILGNDASAERYQADSSTVFLAEGVEALVPFEGSVVDVITLCTLALRKGMRYVKAPNIKYHQDNTLFKRITGSGLRESHPHDVEIVKQ